MIPREFDLIGREAELDRIDAFLGGVESLPGGLVIEGPAGAGKTTIWRAAVERASLAGYVVLTARPAGAEVQLSLAGLTDLLESHLEAVLPSLPAPQRRALEVALLLRDDGNHPPSQRAIGAGTLNAVRHLAEVSPLVIAIDDAQWLDEPSTEVLVFALRRLGDAPVALIASWRTESMAGRGDGVDRTRDRALDTALERAPSKLEVGPLSLGAMHRLLRTRTSLTFNRRTLQRIHETSAGNPFYALELARAIERSGASVASGAGEPARGGASTAAQPLPLSAGLSDLLADRLAGLPDGTRDALFVVAATSQPTVGLVDAVIAGPAHAALAPAVQASVVRIQGDVIEFAHPLLAAAAYEAPDSDQRRAWHSRIAHASSDPETRARHLALARPGRDRDVAEQLHAAARHAHARGATAAAAELLAEAIDRLPTGESAERVPWILEAAPLLRLAGEADRARAFLEAAVAELPAGLLRSDALLELADDVGGDPGGGRLELGLVEQAIAEAGEDKRRRAAALVYRSMLERSRYSLNGALAFAREALALAEQTDDEPVLAEAHTLTADMEVLIGLGGEPVARFQRALELDTRVHVDAEFGAPTILAVLLIRAGRLAEARPLLLEQRRRAMADGDEQSQGQLCLFLTELEWLAGRWDEAAAHAAEGLGVAERAGLRQRAGVILPMVALVEASRGDADRARALAVEGRTICDDVGEDSYADYARQVLAFLELSLGDAAAAHEHAETYAVGQQIEGTKRLAFIGDEIEALVQLGDVDRAAELADEVRGRGELLGRPPLSAIGARCQALVLAARGKLEAAVVSATEAVQTHERLGLPFEHARSLLVLGEVQRRAKHRRAAREWLTAAGEAFDRLGAHLWSAKAAAERARVGGRSTIKGLSETEARVAALVAEGKSNKEVAAELFVSVRAIEANLSKVYAKLGIRSRTELARRI